jgi:hypothetical protein
MTQCAISNALMNFSSTLANRPGDADDLMTILLQVLQINSIPDDATHLLLHAILNVGTVAPTALAQLRMKPDLVDAKHDSPSASVRDALQRITDLL